jgi:inorganic pyrophosphatase
MSQSFDLAKKFLNQKVGVVIDRQKGSSHPNFPNSIYTVNYGFIPGTIAPDGKELDAYFLGPKGPVEKGQGTCVAIIHRLEDDDDKLVVVTDNLFNISDTEIENQINFAEKYHKHQIVRN